MRPNRTNASRLTTVHCGHWSARNLQSLSGPLVQNSSTWSEGRQGDVGGVGAKAPQRERSWKACGVASNRCKPSAPQTPQRGVRVQSFKSGRAVSRCCNLKMRLAEVLVEHCNCSTGHWSTGATALRVAKAPSFAATPHFAEAHDVDLTAARRPVCRNHMPRRAPERK